jgi:DNA-binding NarL/FixJ family response regulator
VAKETPLNAPRPRVGEARTGREGIEETERLRPDLVLLDLALPDLNGIQVAERIHRIFPESKILVVTLNEDADLANEVVLRNEVRGYLLKSDVQEELLSAIADVIGGKQFISKRLRR